MTIREKFLLSLPVWGLIYLISIGWWSSEKVTATVEEVTFIQNKSDESSVGSNAFIGAIIAGPIGAYVGATTSSDNSRCSFKLHLETGEDYIFYYYRYPEKLIQKCSQLKDGDRIAVHKFSRGGIDWSGGYTDYPIRSGL